MLVHVEPDDVAAAGHRWSDDGPQLHALAQLIAASGRVGPAACPGAPDLGTALADLGERGSGALRTLAAAADTLAAGLADSGRRYGEVEDRLAIMGRRVIG
jgi:hypothetical protein